jgi:hypothetical protein
MGGCCSCCGSGDNDNGEPSTAEMEMQQREAAKSLQISQKFSAPTLTVTTEGEGDGSVVTGHGLGLVGVALEQDAAYWEWHVSLPARQHVDTTLFGVASKKDRTFYEELKEKEPDEEGEYPRLYSMKLHELDLMPRSLLHVYDILLQQHLTSFFCRHTKIYYHRGSIGKEWDKLDEEGGSTRWGRRRCCDATIGPAHGPVLSQW